MRDSGVTLALARRETDQLSVADSRQLGGFLRRDQLDVFVGVFEVLGAGLSRLERQDLVSERGPELLNGGCRGMVVTRGGDGD